MSGILAWGTYLPRWSLRRADIAAAVGGRAGRGERSVASYDEDTTSMAVEAGVAALGSTSVRPNALYYATTDPAYLDKTNATAVHAALGLDQGVPAYDMVGAVRSGVGALRAALDGRGPTLVVTSDIRTGLPSGADEAQGGDAAGAVLVGQGDAVAEYLGGASATGEFLDRWRLPGATSSQVWEERFGETAYEPLGNDAVAAGLKSAGVRADDVDSWIVTGTHARAVRRLAGSLSAAGGTVVDDLADSVGNAGAAQPLLLLGASLEQAQPNQTIALVVLADGVEVLVFRTTEHVADVRPARTVAEQLGSRRQVSYMTYLSWRGVLELEPPRRPEPPRPAAPVAHRSSEWKFAFVSTRCEACGTRQLPPQRVCHRCGAIDQMRSESLAGVTGRIATFTIDRLAYSKNPPVVIAVVDFEDGGRYTCELTDVDASEVAIGDRIEMTFRRLFTTAGVHNYFWKGRPVLGGAPADPNGGD